jgi:formate dehydrogenase subunit gamma
MWRRAMVERPPWSLETAQPIIDRWAREPGGLLPLLIELQETFGYIDDEAIPPAAEAVNLSRAEVVGVVNFYHDFRRAPSPAHILKVCLAEACQAQGSDRLVEHLRELLGAGPGEVGAGGLVAIDPVYCLGNCGLSPAVMLDGRPIGRVTPERAEALFAEMRP